MDISYETLSPTVSKKDRSFLYSLNAFIEEELSCLSSNDLSKERFLIYKQAFNKILDYVQAYKVLLGAIKKEYELCIEALEKGQLEGENVRKELHKAITYPLTLFNLQKRKDELKARFDVLNIENKQLVETLNRCLQENEKFRPKDEAFKKYAFLSFETKKRDVPVSIKSDEYLISGLDIENATDINYLMDLLGKIEFKIKELQMSQVTKYTQKDRKMELQDFLFDKIQVRDQMQAKTDNLKHKLYLYKLAINAAKEYYGGNSPYGNIQEALTKAILSGSLAKHIKIEDESDHADDNALENDAEYILDYIDRFNELFENGLYKEAAYFAAASPRNVLRNMETLYRFKTVSNIELGDNDPLMLFCKAIVDSITDNTSLPSADISLECIRVALDHEKLDILTRWVAQKKLTFSYEAAKCIQDYVELKSKHTKKGLELALFIYTEINAIIDACICMVKLGRTILMINYINSQKNFKPSAEHYLQILQKCPDLNLAIDLVDTAKTKNIHIQIEQIIPILLDSDQPYNGLRFLKHQIDKLAEEYERLTDEKQKEECKQKQHKLKSSYDTLWKFSFLTRNDDQFTKSVAAESRDQLQQLYSRLSERALTSSIENSLSMSNSSKKQKSTDDEKESSNSSSINNKQTVSVSSNDANTENVTEQKQQNETTNEPKTVEEMAKELERRMHNNFYNNLDEEMFDDDDLNE